MSQIATMLVLADTKATHVVNAPAELVDLSQWLFSLTDETYQRCSSAHIAGGTSETPDGKRMSINVERISGNLLVQHYVEEVAEPDHVRVNSLSNSYTAEGSTTLNVTWELTATRLSDRSCEFANRVIVKSTPAFLEALALAGVTDFDAMKARMAKSTEDHNREETPFFARDIEGKALQGIWHTPGVR
jgi:hypothetical protein